MVGVIEVAISVVTQVRIRIADGHGERRHRREPAQFGCPIPGMGSEHLGEMPVCMTRSGPAPGT